MSVPRSALSSSPRRDAIVAGAILSALGAGCALIAGLSPRALYPPNSIAQVSAGGTHACALTRGGNVVCWGANDSGQLGLRPIDGGMCTTACPPAEVAGLDNVVQVSAGMGFTCAVRGDGAVLCWGGDTSGELGRPAAKMCPSGVCDPVPDGVEGVTGAIQVSAAHSHACARTGDGTVVCWGANDHGQLGTGDFTVPTIPQAVKGIGVAADVSATLLGTGTCAAASGSVWCWGSNTYGAAGHAPDAGPDAADVAAADGTPCSPSPALVPGIDGAITVRSGGYGACAASTTTGFLCWGYDGLGALGLGFSTPTSVLPPEPLQALPNATQLDHRDTTTCALDPSGMPWCWGQSGTGALGPAIDLDGGLDSGVACDQMTACEPLAQGVGLGSIVQVSTGSLFTLALSADGTVWAFGANDSGQLGHAPGAEGDTTCAATKAACNPTPIAVPGLGQ